jgi:hypothetical protein
VKTNIDLQTLIGFSSATALPSLFKAIIAFLNPSIYTLVCGKSWIDGVADCYAADRAEAILWLCLSAIAVGYGVWTLYRRLGSNPTPTNTVAVRDVNTGEVTRIATVAAPGDPAAAQPSGAQPQKV